MAPEGGAEEGGGEHGGGRCEAGGHQLAHSGVHGSVGRQAARLAAQLSKHVAATCTQVRLVRAGKWSRTVCRPYGGTI